MRQKLCDKYPQERQAICNKLLEILELKEDNTFLLCDLDADIEKQTAILALKDDIQRVFPVSTISAFRPNITHTKRPYVNILRGVLRKQGYTVESNDVEYKMENSIYKKTMKYKINKNVKE